VADVPRFFADPGTHYFLFGPRGTGKSTWLRVLHPDALRIDLLRPETQRTYLAHPEQLREVLDAHPDRKVIVVHEVQKAPQLLDVVHEMIEARRGQHRFVLIDGVLCQPVGDFLTALRPGRPLPM